MIQDIYTLLSIYLSLYIYVLLLLLLLLSLYYIVLGLALITPAIKHPARNPGHPLCYVIIRIPKFTLHSAMTIDQLLDLSQH